MTNDKIYLVLRFYGRFVVVESKNPPDLIIIAAKMNIKGQKVARHDSLLTIREGNVDRRTGTELAPIYRMMPSNVVPYDGARLIWDIAGCDIDIPITGKFEWKQPWVDLPIADLGTLSKRRLNKKSLQVGRGSRANAIVRVHAGWGTAFQKLDDAFRLTRYEYVCPGEPSKPAGALADMVQVVLPLPDDGVALSFKQKKSTIRVLGKSLLPAQLPFGLDPNDGKSGGLSGVVLSFSNLCTTAHDLALDSEFSAFYEMVENPPVESKRWIPQAQPVDKKSTGDSPLPRRVQPFGDCYTNAKIRLDD